MHLKNQLKILQLEAITLNKIYRNYKLVLKSSILIGRINEVRKLSNRFLRNSNFLLKTKLLESCLNLFIAISNIFVLSHYQQLCLVLFGVCSRIYKIVDSNDFV